MMTQHASFPSMPVVYSSRVMSIYTLEITTSTGLSILFWISALKHYQF